MSGSFLSATDFDLVAISGRIRQARFFRCLTCSGLLFFADMLAFLTVAVLVRSGHTVPKVRLDYVPFVATGSQLDLIFALCLAFVGIRYIAGDYTRRQMFWNEARGTTFSLLIVSVPSVLLISLSSRPYALAVMIASWVVLLPLVPLYRHFVRLVLSRAGMWQLPMALIGDGAKIDKMSAILEGSPSLGFDVRFLICGSEVRSADSVVRRLYEAACLEAVFIAENGQVAPGTKGLIDRLTAAGIGVALVPPPQNFPMIGMKIDYPADWGRILPRLSSDLWRIPGRFLKWGMDFFGALLLLLALSPFFLIIAWMIKRADGGKAFFVQKRVGLGGREFPCIKFRTMRADAEEMLKRWKQENSPLYREYVASNFKLRNDPRVTGIGKRLRRTSLDELPQLFNVLCGEMSLIGPRPLLAREIGEYGQGYGLYKTVQPGMSGLWQVSGRSHTTFADRAAADAWYVRNWSLWYDIVLLLKTVGVLAKRDGAY